MNTISRVLVIIYSLFLAIGSMILLYAFWDINVISQILALTDELITSYRFKWFFFAVLLATVGIAAWTISYVILSGRLGKTRIRSSELGIVDIGADAIESIALNSAKMSQAGIKSAKARVAGGKNGMIKVSLTAVLYSNVEIPAMMNRVQERIKKDIERYTGMQVEDVSVKVTRVEPVVVKVER